jgi:hypothetical protein
VEKEIDRAGSASFPRDRDRNDTIFGPARHIIGACPLGRASLHQRRLPEKSIQARKSETVLVKQTQSWRRARISDAANA